MTKEEFIKKYADSNIKFNSRSDLLNFISKIYRFHIHIEVSDIDINKHWNKIWFFWDPIISRCGLTWGSYGKSKRTVIYNSNSIAKQYR